jgi:hypothetical protein
MACKDPAHPTRVSYAICLLGESWGGGGGGNLAAVRLLRKGQYYHIIKHSYNRTIVQSYHKRACPSVHRDTRAQYGMAWHGMLWYGMDIWYMHQSLWKLG